MSGASHAAELPSAEELERSPLLLFAVAQSVARAVAGGGPSLPEETLEPLRRHAPRLAEADPEALLEHIDAVLCGADPGSVLAQLQPMRVLAVLLPEVDALVGFHSACAVHHKDLWRHTLQVIGNAEPVADMRWVALMHDIGKVPTRLIDDAGKVSFWRHEEVGAFLMRGVGARLRMSPERVERIAFVIRYHGLVNAYQADWSDRAVRRLIRKIGPQLDELLRFARVDITTRRSKKAAQIQTELAQLGERVQRLTAEDALQPMLPRGLGHAIRDELDLVGPEIGAALRWLESEIAATRLPAGDTYDVYLQALEGRSS